MDAQKDLVADRVIGSGFANSAAFLDGTIADPSTDAVSIIKNYGQEWFLPSGHEMNAVGIVLGSSPEAIAENGLADLYATSTVMSQNPNCLYQTRDLFFLNIRTSTAYGYCGGFPIRPMRAIINRLSLNLNYASSTTNLVRTAIGQPEVLLPQAKRYGYRFDGWFAQAEGGSLVALGGNETTQALVANGSVLYAHWALVGSYDVAFDVQGATSGAIANATHLINGAQVPLPTEPDISYPGHHLEGWALSPEGTPIEGTYLPLSD